MSKQIKTYLGRSLIKNLKNKRSLNKGQWIHSEEFYDGSIDDRSNKLQSKIEENELEQLLNRAANAGKNYEDDQNLQYINQHIPINVVNAKVDQVYLRLPRRPNPVPGLDVKGWKELEERAFTEWRRALATYQEGHGSRGVMTPFEKNLEVWRQLWRVVERSDVVVQIVDARDTNFYRNVDLESHVTTEGSRDHHERRAPAPEPKKAKSYRKAHPAKVDVGLDDDNGEGGSGAEEDSGSEQSVASDDPESEPEPEAELPKKTGSGEEGASAPFGGKINILLLNKSDLLSRKQRRAWQEHFEKPAQGNEGPGGQNRLLVLGKANLMGSHQFLTRNFQLGSRDRPTLVIFFSAKRSVTPHPMDDYDTPTEDSDDIFSPDDLIFFFRSCLKPCFEKAWSEPDSFEDESSIGDKGKDIHRRIFTIGFVGYPNVGKSSTINALLKAKKVAVSATPGKTKHLQTHLLPEKDIYLCDCPGLVMPNFVESKADLIVHGVLPIDTITDPLSPIALICRRVPVCDINLFYGLDIPESTVPLKPELLLTAHSTMRGFTTILAQPDFHRSARIILKDYVNGRLVYCHAPPGCDADAFKKFAKPLHLSKAQTNAVQEAALHSASVHEAQVNVSDGGDVANAGVKKCQNTIPLNNRTKLLLEESLVAEVLLDNEFFGQVPPLPFGCKGNHSAPNPHRLAKGASTQSLASTDTLMTSGYGNIKDLNPGKKHFNRNKREKLRRLNPNPW